MPKVEFKCLQCGSLFYRYPSAIRDAERRGSTPKFCSRKCIGLARSAGLIGAKKRHGTTISCAICGTDVYRQPKRIKPNRIYTCSEACRIEAHEQKLIDRTGERPILRRGQFISCKICGNRVYRKKSMIERRIRMTCGDPSCVSAYSRSLWGLPPWTEEQKRRHKGTARRLTNFTAAQRVEWLGNRCVKCGTVDNLCLDHINPVAAGGLSVKENSQTLCQPCNIWKSNHEDRHLALALKQTQSGG